MKKAAQTVSPIIATVILFIVFDVVLMTWQLTPITAVSKYANVKRLRWHNQDLVKHFPKEIPSSSQGARFYYRAGFLQGGSSIELRVQMPEEFVEEAYATYMSQAKFTYKGAGGIARGPNDVGTLPKSKFFTFPLDQQETPGEPPYLPQDFETLLLLSTHPYNWNHGQTSGISISRKRREIIYWAEDW